MPDPVMLLNPQTSPVPGGYGVETKAFITVHGVFDNPAFIVTCSGEFQSLEASIANATVQPEIIRSRFKAGQATVKLLQPSHLEEGTVVVISVRAFGTGALQIANIEAYIQ